MRSRKWMAFVVFAVICSLLVIPINSQAGIEEIQQQIKQIEQKQKEAEQRKKAADQALAQVNKQLNKEKKDYEALQKEIAEQGRKLDELNLQIMEVNNQLEQTKKELEAAEARVAERDQMLKSRVQFMYMNSAVSYLDVLFNATSFTDLINRFEMLQQLVGKDQEILEANKRDRDAIEINKRLQEQQLAEREALYAEAQVVMEELKWREKEKEVMIASLTEQEHIHEEISEEQERLLEELVEQKRIWYAKLEEEKRKQQQNQSGAFQYSGGQLAWPLPGYTKLSSEFGYRIDPIKKVNKLHKGIDIPAPKGTAIVAAEAGRVILASWVNGYGYTVVIDHGGLETWYAHMSKITVKEGAEVNRGDKIGEVGTTGDSTGNHLHFEVRTDKGPVNPLDYLK